MKSCLLNRLSLRLFLVLVLLLAFLGMSAKAYAMKVYFAGYAFVGDHGNIENNYPFSSALNQERDSQGISILETALGAKVQRAAISNFSLISKELGNLDKNQGISVAFALDTESVAVEKIGNYYKLVVDLGAQILFFDFNELKVIGTYPIFIQLIDCMDNAPNEIDIINRIRELYLGSRYNLNIFDEFIRRIKKVNVEQRHRNSIKVTRVVVEEKALDELPPALVDDMENCETFLAQNFSKFLSANQQISVLPYTKGHVIGNKMAARFSNGEIYNLSMPDPEYEVELTLRGFKKAKHDENKAGASWIYGSYMHLKIFEPLSNRVYLDERLMKGATKIIPAAQKTIDDWPAFQDSLFALFDSVTRDFAADRKYNELKRVLEMCK